MIPITLVLASILLALFSGVEALGSSDLGHPFMLLPKQSSWQTLAVEAANATQITALIHAYMAPFTEFQKAARDLSVPAEQLKANVMAALDLLAEASQSLNIPKSEYDDAKKDLDSALKLPMTVFTLKRARAVQPTFTPESLAAFTKLRMSHLLTHKAGYMNYLVAKYQYDGVLKEWQITATRLPKCKFRSLMPRNLDMVYIEHSLAVYLDAMRLREKFKEGMHISPTKKLLMKLRRDRLLKNMESLGNGYAVSKPPYSAFLILATSMYALLITLMI
jgi:hypothetical protein